MTSTVATRRFFVCLLALLWLSPVASGAIVKRGQERAQAPPTGQPIWYEQNPPLLQTDNLCSLSFDDFLVAGDVETLTFARWTGSEYADEIWTRVATTSIEGSLVSVFNPTWRAARIRELNGHMGQGRGEVHWGMLVSPAGSFHLSLRTAPLNLPPSRVQRIDGATQYASHVVNIAIPHASLFPASREIARRFYAHFSDAYDVIAAYVPVMGPAGQHETVRNPIDGLGEVVYDDSASYGSGGRLRAVEMYTGSAGNVYLAIHETVHQWVDFWDWSALADGAEMRDRSHTPLLYPGTTFAGILGSFGVWGHIVERGGSFVFERTQRQARRLHPLTLYRMGLIKPEAVPEVFVFENQRQHPFFGDTIEGGYRRVRINDIIALHGPRSGPVDSTWHRATVVVSRGRLLSYEEMSYWNFFAARLEALGDVPGETTFYEATGGLARLYTDVTPATAPKIQNTPALSAALPIDPNEFPGVILDAPVPPFLAIGEPVVVAGVLTSTELDDFTGACVQFIPVVFDTPISRCGPIVDRRFSVEQTFSEVEAADYTLSIRLHYDDAAGQRHFDWRGNVGSIRVAKR